MQSKSKTETKKGKTKEDILFEKEYRNLDNEVVLSAPKNAYFIVLEGIDGSGKGAQVSFLKKFFKSRRAGKLIATREPTKRTQTGREINKVLVRKEKISPKRLQELFCKDREYHLKRTIMPALKKGKVVVSDRYFFSTIAYGMADGLDESYLFGLNKNFLLPDLVFFLDVKPAVSLKRVAKRGKEKSIFEKKGKLEKVYKSYKMIFRSLKKRLDICFINGNKPIGEVSKEIRKVLEKAV